MHQPRSSASRWQPAIEQVRLCSRSLIERKTPFSFRERASISLFAPFVKSDPVELVDQPWLVGQGSEVESPGRAIGANRRFAGGGSYRTRKGGSPMSIITILIIIILVLIVLYLLRRVF